LENQFIAYDLCEDNYERRVEVRVPAVLEDARMRKRDREVNKFVETQRPVGMMQFQMNALDIFHGEHLYNRQKSLFTAFGFHIF
jgi:hypothetical protein